MTLCFVILNDKLSFLHYREYTGKYSTSKTNNKTLLILKSFPFPVSHHTQFFHYQHLKLTGETDRSCRSRALKGNIPIMDIGIRILSTLFILNYVKCKFLLKINFLYDATLGAQMMMMMKLRDGERYSVLLPYISHLASIPLLILPRKNVY